MKKIIILTLSAGVLLFSSCSKSYLDTKPTDSVSPEIAISNVTGANLAMRGCYRDLALRYGSQNYNGEPNLAISEDMQANLIQRTLKGNGWFQDIYNPSSMSSQTSNPVEYPWYMGYLNLKSVNEILAKIDEIVPRNAAEEALQAHIKAECLTLSAYHHYRLAGWYSNPYKQGQENNQLSVPIKTTVDYAPIPRETLEKAYAFCLDNLAKALTLYNGAAKNVNGKDRDGTAFYITKEAAHLIRARIYMIQGKWQLALDDAKEAMKGRTLNGIAGIKNPNWFSEAVRNKSSETIWGLEISSKNNMAFNSFYMYLGANNSSFIKTGPLSMWAPLINKIPNTDVRKEWFVLDDAATINANKKADANYYSSGAGTSFLSKTVSGSFVPIPSATVVQYQSRKFQTADKENTAGGDFVILRLAEAYYIAAEAAYMAGDETAAKKYLTDANVIYDATFVAKTGAELLQQIYDYKHFDLWGEGRGMEDMRRRGASWDRTVAGSNANLLLGIVEKVDAKVPADWKYIKRVVPKREITMSNGIVVPDPEI